MQRGYRGGGNACPRYFGCSEAEGQGSRRGALAVGLGGFEGLGVVSLFLLGEKSRRGKGRNRPTFRKKTGSEKNETSCSVLRGRCVSWTGLPAKYKRGIKYILKTLVALRNGPRSPEQLRLTDSNVTDCRNQRAAAGPACASPFHQTEAPG